MKKSSPFAPRNEKLYSFSAFVDSKEIFKGSIYDIDEISATKMAKLATRFELCESKLYSLDDIQIVFLKPSYTIK
jgi:hypothetical protein